MLVVVLFLVLNSVGKDSWCNFVIFVMWEWCIIVDIGSVVVVLIIYEWFEYKVGY